MEAVCVTCPLCQGHKKVFQLDLFRHALEACPPRQRAELSAMSFVRDCSVCAGNGWVSPAALESARREAADWRASGVCAY